MTRSRSTFLATCAFLTFAGYAMAQPASSTTTTTTWDPATGQQLTQSWTTNHYVAPPQPGFTPTVGVEVPSGITLYPVPDSINVPDRDNYSYTVIDNRPVVVDRTTRRVVHTWGP